MALDDLYREVILDHYRTPRNQGSLDPATAVIDMTNPACGDEISLYLQVEAGKVQGIRFEGRGCSISQASASMMTEAVDGQDIAEVTALIKRFKGMMTGELSADEADVGDLESLQGVSKFPVRIKCALMAWEALDRGINSGEE